MGVVLRVAKQLKILRNITEILREPEIYLAQSLKSSLLSRNDFFALVVKSYAKVDINVLWSCPIFLIFLLFAKCFVRDSNILLMHH